MAQKVRLLLLDDMDESTADETVTFGRDAVTCEIDLTTACGGVLRAHDR